jgi:hypothetical protein
MACFMREKSHFYNLFYKPSRETLVCFVAFASWSHTYSTFFNVMIWVLARFLRNAGMFLRICMASKIQMMMMLVIKIIFNAAKSSYLKFKCVFLRCFFFIFTEGGHRSSFWSSHRNI